MLCRHRRSTCLLNRKSTELEDLVANIPTLKLPQNRSRLQIIAADLIWKRDQARARFLFSDAAANIVELEKQTGRKSRANFG